MDHHFVSVDVPQSLCFLGSAVCQYHRYWRRDRLLQGSKVGGDGDGSRNCDPQTDRDWLEHCGMKHPLSWGTMLLLFIIIITIIIIISNS